MAKNFYITTPIYYVNASPHIGSAYTTVAADVLARWNRLLGNRTFFLTGTDEHGAKIEAKAAEAGMEPLEFVDSIADKFKTAWSALDISYDGFIRTTAGNHKAAVARALQFLHDKGDIYLGKYEGLYCRGCEQFKHEKDLVDGRCPDHGTVPETVSEETYLFRMSKYADELLEKIKSDEYRILPVERKHEVVSFIEREGLNDISFSRKNVGWGIPLPWDASHTTYVWADAFLNYLTGLGWSGDPASVKDLEYWPVDIQLMSKDILRVHATIWPCMLLALGVELPKKLFIHGFFQVDGQKMSKSLGNVISPDEMLARYGVDATRYLVISSAVFGQDGDITWARLDEKYSSDLANGLGNLVSRVSNLLEKNGIMTGLQAIDPASSKIAGLFQELKLDEILKTVWAGLRHCDEDLTAKAPWKMTDRAEIESVLLPIAQTILDSAYLLQPFMPVVSDRIIRQFSEKQVEKNDPLFPRLAS